MSWQLLDLHSLSMLPCPKIQLPLTLSVAAFHFTNAGELCSCPAVLQRERHNPASNLADVAVHTDPPRELGSAHVGPLAGLVRVGKHWWS